MTRTSPAPPQPPTPWCPETWARPSGSKVSFTDDEGSEETLTSALTAVVTVGLQLQSATVNGSTLTLAFNEDLDTGVTLRTTLFAVRVNGSSRSRTGDPTATIR